MNWKVLLSIAGKQLVPTARLGQPTALMASIVVATLILTACGNAAPTSESNSTDAAQGSTGAVDQQSGTPQDAALGTEEFGMTKQQLVENIEAVEAKIAQCMHDAGFEYVAVDYDTARKGMTSDKSMPGVSDEQYIAQYGYGISTLYTGLPPQAADDNTPAKIGLGQQNVDIYNKLSDADKVAYTRTLLGQNTDATFAVTLELEDFSRTGGCTRKAVEQVFTEDQLKATYLNPLDARIEQDPRMLAAVAQFADCLRKDGFNYNHPDEIESEIKKRLDAITNGAPVDTLSPDAKAALTELQGEEKAVAVAATKCAEEIIEPVHTQIERELAK
ncbi:MAG: hypothetical protein U0175_25020 [Caldilineaceae bacterium]